MLLLASLDFYVAINNIAIGDGLIFTDRQKTQNADGRAAAESLKRWFFFTCYVATIALAIAHYKAIVRAIRSNKILFLIPPILVTGIFISINPISVMTNTLQIVVGILAAAQLALAHHSRESRTNLYSSVLLASSPIIICSLGLLLLIQLHPFEFIMSNKRFGGFAGNPNTLGSISAISIWASLALLTTYRLSVAKKLFIAINIALCILCIALSGSGTSIVLVVLTVLVFGWFLLSSRLSSNKTLGLYALTIVFATLSFIALLTVYTPEQLLEKIYVQLGKDSTMTGRTDLWGIALEAIRQKWLLGWGFDSHQSVMADPLFHIDYNHFHNGFLDTFLAGGIVLLTATVLILLSYLKKFLQIQFQTQQLFPLAFPLIYIVLLNISEYSLLRPLSPFWHIFLCGLFVLTFELHRLKRLHKLNDPAMSGHFGAQLGLSPQSNNFKRRKKRKRRKQSKSNLLRSQVKNSSNS